MTGVMSGLALGETLMTKVALKYPSSLSHAAARAVLGLSCLMSMFLGLRQLEKTLSKESTDGTPTLAVQTVRFSRYGSVPVVILVLAPLLFNKLRI